ncbi:MAG: hypothetical protein WEB00_14450 [Dehalococcoidia bacterium]
MGAGYWSIEPGTRVTSSRIVGLDPYTWRVDWINDGTADEVKLTVVCWRAEPSIQITSSGFGLGGGGFASQGCSDTHPELLLGGFMRIARTSRLLQSSPESETNWQVTLRVPAGEFDDFRLQVICTDAGYNTYRITIPSDGGGGANPTFTASCKPGDVLTGVGFAELAAGSSLRGVFAIALDTARISWQNGPSPDTVELRIVCLQVVT